MKGNPRGKPWAKGVSGNPSGRPKSNLNRLLSEFVAKKATVLGRRETYEQLMVQQVVALALKGDKDMLTFVWDRLEGKPAQSVDFTDQATVNLIALVAVIKQASEQRGLPT